MTTCYCGGSYDLFHRGHVELLRAAAAMAERVVVAVNSDAFHTAYKGKPPVVAERDRLAVVLACRYVTHAFLMPDHSAQRRVIAAWEPTYILHGDDWTGESLLRQLNIDAAFLQQHGIQMVYVPYTPGVSTSLLRAEL